MGTEIKFGEEGEEGSASTKLSDTYRQETTESTGHSMTYSFDVTYSVSCTAKPGQEGVGLWQQVTEGTDGKFRVWGTQTICRYGDMWKTAPKCPYAACIDAECLTCADDWQA